MNVRCRLESCRTSVAVFITHGVTSVWNSVLAFGIPERHSLTLALAVLCTVHRLRPRHQVPVIMGSRQSLFVNLSILLAVVLLLTPTVSATVNCSDTCSYELNTTRLYSDLRYHNCLSFCVVSGLPQTRRQQRLFCETRLLFWNASFTFKLCLPWHSLIHDHHVVVLL